MRTIFCHLVAWCCLVPGWRAAVAQDKGAATSVSPIAHAPMSAPVVDPTLLWQIIIAASLLLLVSLYWIWRLHRELSTHRTVQDISDRKRMEDHLRASDP